MSFLYGPPPGGAAHKGRATVTYHFENKHFDRIDGTGRTTLSISERGDTLAYVDYSADRETAEVTVFDPSTSRSRRYAPRAAAAAEAIAARHIAKQGYTVGPLSTRDSVADNEKQSEVDAEAWAAIANDYDPEGFRQHCDEHDHSFLTYCVICPVDHGNGRISDEAHARNRAALDAKLAELYPDDNFPF